MGWVRKGRRLLRRGLRGRRRRKTYHNSTNDANSLVLDLRGGIGYALTRLSVLSRQVDHLIVRQSNFLMEVGLSGVDDEDLSKIFHSVAGRLENLKTLVVSEFEQVELPVRHLILLLRSCLALSALRLDTIRLSGSRQEFESFAEALENHPSLEKICISGCNPLESGEEESDSSESDDSSLPRPTENLLAPLASALSRIPTLTLVEIGETSFPTSGTWTGQSLCQLCQSESLRILRVRGIRFLEDEDITLMAQSLQTNTTLKELWLLSCELGYSGSGPQALAEMLEVNTSLEILGLNRLCVQEHAVAIAKALRFNRSLTGLHLCLRDGLTHQIHDSFTQLMEHNYVLEKIGGSGFLGSDMDPSPIDFYLRLNQRGSRRFLLQNDTATREDWVDALCSQSDDVSALFWLISHNPQLCAVPNDQDCA